MGFFTAMREDEEVRAKRDMVDEIIEELVVRSQGGIRAADEEEDDSGARIAAISRLATDT